MGGKKNEVHAIPTKYKHVQYRSRLEAKWAAMFDLLGWNVQYEPFDLAGWIPDFTIQGEDIILVEIKPFFTFKQFKDAGVPQKIEEAISSSIYKDSEVLLLGASMAPISDITSLEGEEAECGVLGWLSHGDNVIVVHDEDIYDFFPEAGNWYGRIGLSYGGKAIWRAGVTSSELDALWAEAGNITQWKKPKTKYYHRYKKTTHVTRQEFEENDEAYISEESGLDNSQEIAEFEAKCQKVKDATEAERQVAIAAGGNIWSFLMQNSRDEDGMWICADCYEAWHYHTLLSGHRCPDCNGQTHCEWFDARELSWVYCEKCEMAERVMPWTGPECPTCGEKERIFKAAYYIDAKTYKCNRTPMYVDEWYLLPEGWKRAEHYIKEGCCYIEACPDNTVMCCTSWKVYNSEKGEYEEGVRLNWYVMCKSVALLEKFGTCPKDSRTELQLSNPYEEGRQ